MIFDAIDFGRLAPKTGASIVLTGPLPISIISTFSPIFLYRIGKKNDEI
tara:strand:+ start:312 stop:458 length:147 start_codon:yes stop_codon:yes gene_type:complete